MGGGGVVKRSRRWVGRRKEGQGEVAKRLRQLYQLGLRRAGLRAEPPGLSAESFRVPGPEQLELF